MNLISHHRTLSLGRRVIQGALASSLFFCAVTSAAAQGVQLRLGTPLPIEVKSLYETGLAYLVRQQNADGTWDSNAYGKGPGIDGLCCLAMLSCGEDPNFGAYAEPLRRGVRAIIRSQNRETGLLANSGGEHGGMYHHGFGTLALAEAYGALDEHLLWDQVDSGPRSTVGEALELAVRCILTSQDQNPFGGWRYTPDAQDADVSVSGANLVALLAARNAGLEIPEDNLNRAIGLLEQATEGSGTVAYQVGSTGFAFGDSVARSSIVCLCLAIAERKESAAFQATAKYLRERIDRPPAASWPYYTRYYLAQALYQSDFPAWEQWNSMNTESLEGERGEDGSIGGGTYSTAMSLLSMALNYRFLPIYER